MNRFFTLCAAVVCSLAMQAQVDETLQFVDANGAVVPDGTALTIEAEGKDDGFGGVIMEANSGLSVLNTSDDETACGVSGMIQQMDNGVFQICFPMNCLSFSAVGPYETPQGALSAQEVHPLLSEWQPEAYGEAMVTYHLARYKFNPITRRYSFVADGPSVTVNYVYADPAGVHAVEGDAAVKHTAYYDLQGRLLGSPARGLCIRQSVMADGTVRTQKVVMRN